MAWHGALAAEVFDGEVLIGSVLLEPLDPSMGVVGGIFVPNSNYRAERHARTEATEPVADLTVRDETGKNLKCAGVDLVDYSEGLDDSARQIAVLGLEEFTTRFDARP